MRYLLDTHALLWARGAPDQLSPEALAVLESTGNMLYLSVASLWECAIKYSIGKLEVPDGFFRTVAGDYEIPGVETAHVEECAKLPMHRRDPFDRMLIGLTLVTRDRNIAMYDVPVVTA